MTGRTLVRRVLGVAVVAMLVAPLYPAAPAAASPNRFLTMSDGVQIAVNIRMPDDFKKGQSYPTIFEMSGYDGGASDGDEPYAGEGSRALTKQFYKDYVTIHASIRGTGCSGGEFDLFSWRSALDGREIIDWIDQQEWSNGKIGIYGHSYGGITGFMVAATRPPELDAVSVSGLIDDIYRGIVYPGGVSNYGFPLLWTGGVRNAYDIGGGFLLGMDEGGAESGCIANAPTKSRTVVNDAIVQGIQDTDNTWMQSRSLINYAERINVPAHLSGMYQDEQTGPRGFTHLFEAIDNAPVRRLLIGNGDHGSQQSDEVEADRRAFLNHFLLGEGPRSATSSVTTLLERVDEKATSVYNSRTFPLENTRWTDYYLQPEGGISTSKPDKGGGSSVYFSGSGRQSWSYQAGGSSGSQFTTPDGPDEVTFESDKLKEPVTMIGPATATLFVSTTAPDTELFVQVIDEAPDGSRYYLQRGMLKASHRAILDGLSDKIGNGTIYRPWRPHTNPTFIEPGKVYKYLVEIFPFGHVFRPGHRLVVKVHAPPHVDSYYAYVPNKRFVGVNTLLHDAEHPSSLMLPVIPLPASHLGREPKPCSQSEIRCIPA